MSSHEDGMEPQPWLLLCGAPRSGTSLLRAYLASHSGIAMLRREVPLFTSLYWRYGSRPLSVTDQLRLRTALVDSGTLTQKFQAVGLDALLPVGNAVPYVDLVARLIGAIGGDKLPAVKLPRAELTARDLIEATNMVRVLHIVRDPGDVLLSTTAAHRRWWGGGVNPWLHSAYWSVSTEQGLRAQKEHANQYRVVSYERLVREPLVELREICEWLGLAFEAEMVSMNGQPDWSGRNSSFENRPRPDLTSRQRAALASCSRVASIVGYSSYEPSGLIAKIAAAVRGSAAQGAWAARHKVEKLARRLERNKVGTLIVKSIRRVHRRTARGGVGTEP